MNICKFGIQDGCVQGLSVINRESGCLYLLQTPRFSALVDLTCLQSHSLASEMITVNIL